MFNLKPSHLLVLSCLLLPAAARADEDTRVQKTVLLDNITFKPVAEAKPDEIALRDKNDIFLSPDAAHIAVRLDSANEGESILLDGKAGAKYQKISQLSWRKNGDLFYVGHRDGKDHILRNNIGQGVNADEIRGLTPPNSKELTLQELSYLVSGDYFPSLNYAKRTGENWQLILQRSWPSKLRSNKISKASEEVWANISGVWPSATLIVHSVAYEVTDAKGKVALLQDGESLGGPRSIFDGVAVNPVWSPNGKHIAYCVKNGTKDYLCVDGKPVSVIDRAPQFSWSPISNRLVVWGNELKTFSININEEGKPSIGNAIDATPFTPNQSKAGITWSRDGMHWGFFAPTSGDIYVDGVKKISIPKGNGFPSLLALDEDASTVAYSYKNVDTISVKAGDFESNGFKAVQSLRFNDEGKAPLFLAQKDGNWSLHSGNEDIAFLNSANDKAQPLTDWLPQRKGVYRIVMLEEEAENSKIVRYDINIHTP